jgi:flagellin-like hook-associated protein FlgL
MAVKGIATGASEQARGPLQSNTPQFSRVSVRRSPVSSEAAEGNLQAASVSISDAERSRQSGLDSALRNLAPLQTFVTVAADATDRARQVLGRALDLTKQITNEVDPNKRSSLASESISLINELDKIAAAKTPNGLAVAGQGPVSYSLSLDGSDPKENTLTVNLPSILLSKSDLALSSLSTTSFTSANTATQKTLNQAIDVVSITAAGLDSASSAISSVASAYGVDKASLTGIDEERAQEYSEQIASAIKSNPDLVNANKLDPDRVLQLLKDGSEEESYLRLKSKTPKEEESPTGLSSALPTGG